MGYLAHKVKSVGGSRVDTLGSISALTRASTLLSGRTAKRRNQGELLKMPGQSGWVRLAVDVVSKRAGLAEFSVLAPLRGSATRRQSIKRAAVRAVDPLKRAEALRGLVDEGELEPVDIPLLDALALGSPGFFDGHQSAMVGQTHRMLVGEQGEVIVRGKGGVVEQLWLFPPHWFTPPDQGHPEAFRLTLPGQTMDIPETEFAWQKSIDAANPYGRGSGIFQALDHEVATHEMLSAYLAALLRNHARPDMLITGSFPDEIATKLKEDLLQDNRGTHRAGGVHFMGIPSGGNGDVQVHDLQKSVADIGGIELARWERDVILQVSGVPPDVIGATESSNRATAHQAERMIRDNTVMPAVEGRCRFLQNRFLEERQGLPPEFGDGELVMSYALPSLVDEEARIKLIQAVPEAFQLNEVREAAQMEPMQELDGLTFRRLQGDVAPIGEAAITEEPDERVEDAILAIRAGDSVADAARERGLDPLMLAGPVRAAGLLPSGTS